MRTQRANRGCFDLVLFKNFIIFVTYNNSNININIYTMASIAQLVSEMARAVRQPNNKALRENVRVVIIQTGKERIRRSYENRSYVEKI